MRIAVDAGGFKRAVDDRVEAARARGVNAVPTFVIDERFVVQGAQTLEVFESVMRRLGHEPR
jgi:predicted DsbA family dithiol-disulfide isomerase